MNNKLKIAYCDEWYGNVYICDKCNKSDIWKHFEYCPMCGVQLSDNFWEVGNEYDDKM